MLLLSKVRVGDAAAVIGSRLNIIRTFPGSVAMEGLTGALK